MKLKLLVLCLGGLLVSGCAVHKNWTATGGSRADATVKLSYEYSEFEQPIVSEQEALDLAIQRCKSWGYASAEAFGGVTRTQNTSSSWLVTKEFQCIGQGTETRRKK